MQLHPWVCYLWVKQRGYSVVSKRIKIVYLNLSVRKRPVAEWSSIVSIHDIEPFQRNCSCHLLFHTNRRFICVLRCARVFLASFLKGLNEFLDQPSSYSHQLGIRVVFWEGTRSKGDKQRPGNQIKYMSGKSNQKDQVLCIFVQFHEYKYEFNLIIS